MHKFLLGGDVNFWLTDETCFSHKCYDTGVGDPYLRVLGVDVKRLVRAGHLDVVAIVVK